jgi:CheY-like chemotaxis protein
MIKVDKKSKKAVNPARILIVEDENIIAMDIQSILQKMGYDVFAIVSSGEESINIASLTMPDIVLMDIKLKGKMNGIQAAEHIYDQFRIPIIFVSAYGDELTYVQSGRFKPFEFVRKPFIEEELEDKISGVLHKSRKYSTVN